MLLLSQVDRISGADPNQSIYPAMGAVMACFLCMRFFGQGCLSMVCRVIVGKWFNYRRGIAAAVGSAITSFAFMGGPVLLNWLLGEVGWRNSCLVLMGSVGVGMSVFGWLFFRDNPEECGLVMDGIEDEAWLKKMSKKVTETTKEFTRAEALGTLSFWAFSLGPASAGLIMTAFFFHLTDLGGELGMSRDEVYASIIFFPFINIPTNFIAGWLCNHIRIKWLLCIMMLAEAVGVLGMLNFNEPLGHAMLIGGFGVTGGLFGTLLTVAFPRFFGRAHLGAISGVNMSLMVFSSAIGPYFFSVCRDWSGSYRLPELLCLVLPLVVFIMALKAENPQESVASTTDV
jgi:cyanate permease